MGELNGMNLICPQHKTPLEITKKTLDVAGNPHNVVIGTCKKCRHKYINKTLFSNCVRFEIGGQVYQYSEALCSAFPPAVIVVKETPKKAISTKKSAPKKKKPKENSNPKATKKSKYDIEIEEMKMRISNNDYESFHADRVCFVEELPKKCKLDGEVLSDVKRVTFETHGVRVKVHAFCCLRCKSVYLTTKKREELAKKIKDLHKKTDIAKQESLPDFSQKAFIPAPQSGVENVCSVPLPFENSEKENISKEGVVVQVYPQKCHCSKCEKKYGQNTMTCKTAVVKTLDGQTIDINIMFCKGCGQYFISSTILKLYQKRYGGLLVELVPYQKITPSQYSIYGFNPDTVLSRCGYSVAKGIPRLYRQSVLTYILESGKAKKYEIIEIISNFIKFRENRDSLEDACERWREDMRFVSEYKIETQKKVYNPRFVTGKK